MSKAASRALVLPVRSAPDTLPPRRLKKKMSAIFSMQ
jgi:hypothetical protein